MLRHRAAIGSSVAVRLIYSSRSLDGVIYRDELMRVAADDEADVRLVLIKRHGQDLAGRSRTSRPPVARRGSVVSR